MDNQVAVMLVANDVNDERHERAVQQYASFANGMVVGATALAEMKNVITGEPEYVIVGAIDVAGEGEEPQFHYLPLAKMLTGPVEESVYLLPDLEGGWKGEVKDGEEEATDD